MTLDLKAQQRLLQIDSHVGSRIRLRRKIAKMSQNHLGEQLGISFQQIQKYERGANRVSASKLHEIATILGVEPCFFFQGIDPSTENKAQPDFLTDEMLQLLDSFQKIKSIEARSNVISIVENLSKQ